MLVSGDVPGCSCRCGASPLSRGWAQQNRAWQTTAGLPLVLAGPGLIDLVAASMLPQASVSQMCTDRLDQCDI